MKGKTFAIPVKAAKAVLVFAVTALCFLSISNIFINNASAAPKRRAGADFTLINNSRRTIVNVYLSPSKYDDWAAEDELINRPLRHGESVEIDFLDRADHMQLQDLRVEYSDGTYDEWTGLDLYNIYEMGIEPNGASSYRTVN